MLEVRVVTKNVVYYDFQSSRLVEYTHMMHTCEWNGRERRLALVGSRRADRAQKAVPELAV